MQPAKALGSGPVAVLVNPEPKPKEARSPDIRDSQARLPPDTVACNVAIAAVAREGKWIRAKCLISHWRLGDMVLVLD